PNIVPDKSSLSQFSSQCQHAEPIKKKKKLGRDGRTPSKIEAMSSDSQKRQNSLQNAKPQTHSVKPSPPLFALRARPLISQILHDNPKPTRQASLLIKLPLTYPIQQLMNSRSLANRKTFTNALNHPRV
ncbi:hypothetical protein KC19_1G256100, partial [Ceratodon purpureus]